MEVRYLLITTCKECPKCEDAHRWSANKGDPVRTKVKMCIGLEHEVNPDTINPDCPLPIYEEEK